MPRQLNGVWISDDGKWTWDGQAWHPTVPAVTGSVSPWRLFFGLVVVLLAIGIAFSAMAAFGWLIAIVGLVLAMAAYRNATVRAWSLWRRVPFLASAGSPAWFAAILAGYLVVTPAGVWGFALASAGATRSSTPQSSAASTHTPPSRSESTPVLSTPANAVSTSHGADGEAEASSVSVATTTTLPPPAPATCGDPHAHVYNPTRLHLLAACVTVNGRVDIIRAEKDGDVHILLRLDPGQDRYINATNISAEHGDLVLEPVCVRAVTQADAVSACAGYVNPLPIPAVGLHVSVTGAWVLDVDHGWMEIHPVASFNAVAAPPTSTPTAAPTAEPPPPPAAATVAFLNSPTAARNQKASLQVNTAPNTPCSIVVVYKNGTICCAGSDSGDQRCSRQCELDLDNWAGHHSGDLADHRYMRWGQREYDDHCHLTQQLFTVERDPSTDSR